MKRWMKRIMAVGMVIGMLTGLMSCSGKDEPKAETESAGSEETKAEAVQNEESGAEDMMKVRNLGRKSLEEVLAKLKELGLQLNPSDE